MPEIICYTNNLPNGTEQYITFLELLLDENWACGDISCPDTVYSEVGGRNKELISKQNYEFLLRAIQKFPLKAVGIPFEADISLSSRLSDASDTDSSQVLWENYRTDCYIAGKYKQNLADSGYMDSVLNTLLSNAANLPDFKAAIDLLDQMLSHSSAYYKIDDDTRPVLIYKGLDICENLLNIFAEELAAALRSCHQPVEIFDAVIEGNQSLTKFIGQHFKAVIGIQTYLFSVMLQDHITNLHDLVVGPKFNMILDHPAWIREHLLHSPKDYYLLLHDRNYIAYSKRYFPQVRNCFHFTPAGLLPPDGQTYEKTYDLTFIGSYRNYRDWLKAIRLFKPGQRHFAARFMGYMRKNPNHTAEEAFAQTLNFYGATVTDETFAELFLDMKQACVCVISYYREKVIRLLLESGIAVQVYGDTWKFAPFASHPNLTCHPNVSVAESLTVMCHSKISLNIMSWHKDGLTERIVNAMLCRSVVLSDRSTSLEELFENGKELVLFDLERLDALPTMVRSLLADNNTLGSIAAGGYEKAHSHHLWLHRAKQLLELIKDLS